MSSATKTQGKKVSQIVATEQSKINLNGTNTTGNPISSLNKLKTSSSRITGAGSNDITHQIPSYPSKKQSSFSVLIHVCDEAKKKT